MSLALLAPLGLAALAALAIPLLLHLHRRQEQQRTVFAALRWIRGPARPRRRIRLEQWPLLLLRLLLLALAALLLARPVWQGGGAAAQERVLVTPGVDPLRAQAAVNAPGARWQWLAPGFPDFGTAPTSESVDNFSSLLREFDAGLPAGSRLYVIVPGIVQGLDGGEIRLSRAVDWAVVEQAPGPAIAAGAPAPRRVSLRTADAAPGMRYLRAALNALNGDGARRFVLAEEAPGAALDDQTALVFWLGAEPSPALLDWVRAGGTALLDSGSRTDGEVIARDAQGEALLLQRREGSGRLLRFSAALDPARMPLLQDGSFPQVLSAALLPPGPPPGSAAAAGVRPVTGAAALTPPPAPLDTPLLALIALLALAERAWSWLDSRRPA